MDATAPRLSLVIPAYNEAQNIDALFSRVLPVLDSLGLPFEVLVIDDGSHDETHRLVELWTDRRPCVRCLRFSRNFGHQAAILAGLDHAVGDAVITMDADLQHPPELIPRMVEMWNDGAEIVQTVRRETADASPTKRLTSHGFYRVLSAMAQIRVAPGAADFRLMTRDAVSAFRLCRERARFNRGLVQWIGFDCRELAYDAEARHAGRTKYSLASMLRLAGDAIFSFSWLPLRVAGLAGAAVSVAAGAYLLFVLWARLFTERTVGGWSSTLATVLILGGMQLIVLWIIGEYIGRIYDEVKQRPLYVLRPTRRG